MSENPFWNYAWIGIAAFLGVIARAARWVNADGKFSWQKCVLELLTAPAIGVITAGGAEFFAPNVDIRVVGAAAALLGLLGTAAIDVIAVKWIEKKAGL